MEPDGRARRRGEERARDKEQGKDSPTKIWFDLNTDECSAISERKSRRASEGIEEEHCLDH